ncbi:unnamed protein product [Aphanomyces euteiches]|uniref:Uncharacterized protein n=1 Tax=Aphanomyces euteiches TaxID=100861 RepID=A0A6G0WLV7_9STRA|nr:hypothetical protein Ae201684_013861 [Aphanomyces euteiches]KAH9080894.1 hypothetical protein Ae201684P_007980 [Aphanomyces euteiches]KAH9155442.1 hypothetical protein AeRB84_002583 [Aphanomyces euteiches]
MKRNGFDQVEHALYVEHVGARVLLGEDPRQIESFRKYKYKQRHNIQSIVPPPVEEKSTAPVDSNHECNSPSPQTVSTIDALEKQETAEHEYLMRLICPALRTIKSIALTRLEDARAADTFQIARPCARDGASLTACRDFLVLFGGCYANNPSYLHPRAIVQTLHTQKGSLCFANDVYTFSPATNVWDMPRLSGSYPKGRTDHSAVFLDPNLVVFGGRGKHSTVFRDLWLLSIETWTWSELKPSSLLPSPKFWHAAAALNNRLFVFGGKDLDNVYGDMIYLDVGENTWTTVYALGQPPPPRFGANMHALSDGMLLVVGGWESRPLPFHDPHRWLDLYVLDTVIGVWSRPHLAAHFRTCHQIPQERLLFASFVVDNSTTLVVFGGYTYHHEDAFAKPWFEQEPSTPVPLGRVLYGKVLEPVNDTAVFTLNLEALVWRRQRCLPSYSLMPAGGAGPVLQNRGYMAAIDGTETLLVQVIPEERDLTL